MTSELAHIIQGEAGICGFWAMLAVAWVYQRNQTFYAYSSPGAMAAYVAENWWRFPDPTRGATFLVNDLDLQQAAVRKYTIARGPPSAVFRCRGGRALFAFGGDEQTFTYTYREKRPLTSPLFGVIIR